MADGCLQRRPRRKFNYAAVAGPLLLILVLLPFFTDLRFTVGAQTFHFAVQHLDSTNPWRDEGFLIRSGWDGPTGDFTSCETYGVKAWSWCLRCDIVTDPMAGEQRKLPRSPESLAKIARSSDQFMRMAALARLAEMGAAAAPALPLLISQMKAGDDGPTDAITKICTATPALAAHLIAAAAMSGSVTARCNLILILPEAGPEANEAAPALRPLLRDPEPQVVIAAAYALAKIGGTSEETADALGRLIYSTNSDTCASALAVLGEVGAQSTNLEPAITHLLYHSNEEVQAMAARALATLRRTNHVINHVDSAVLARLAQLARTPRLPASQWAIDALSTMGSPAATILGPMLATNAQEEIHLVAEALIKLGPAAGSELPKLAILLTDESTYRAEKAAEIIGHLGPVATNVHSQLENALAHDSVHVRITAARALWRLTHRTNEIWPVIMTALVETNTYSHSPQFAADAIAEIGPSAFPASSSLRQMLSSPRENVRRAANKALESINETP